jgi:hypothetical protein
VTTAVVSFVCQAPALEVKRSFFATIVRQGNHLLRPLPVIDDASHEAKLAFRLVPPLLVHTLHLSVSEYYVVQGLLGVATLAGLAWLFHNVGYTRRDAALIVVGLAFTYMGAVWFVDSQPYFDAIAATVLVTAMCVRHPAVVFVAGSVALWTDERAILALGVVALFHLYRDRRNGALAAAAAFAAYVALRVFLGARYGLSTGKSEIGPSVLVDFWTAMPLAIALALEGLWVLLVVAYGTALRARQWTVVAAGVLTAGSLAAAVMVNDVTRSTVYALPGVVFAIAYLADKPRRPLTIGLVLCVVIPTAATIVTSGAVLDHVSFFYPVPVRLIF